MNKIKLFLTPIFVICAKEMLDGFRDRYSTISVLIGPLIAPLVIVWLFSIVSDSQLKTGDDIEFPVIGAQYAAELMGWINAQEGVKTIEGPEDPAVAVKKGEIDFALIIPEDFAKKLAAEQTVEVQLVSDRARIQALPTLGRVEDILHSYQENVVVRRLQDRRVDPGIVVPIQIANVDVGRAQGAIGPLTILLPGFIMLAAFICGMHVAVDAVAGERERQSLEPLLTLGLPRASIIMGKWLSVVVLSCAGVSFTVLGVIAALYYAQADFEPSLYLGVLIMSLPVAFLAPSLQMMVSVIARSFKEAEIYILYLWILPLLPSIGALLSDTLNKEMWMMAIPFFSQHILITDALAQGYADWFRFMISLTSTFIACAFFLALTARLFKEEKLVFGFR
ncbi:MAG: ABC transporter permease subunit [Candidatus Latescibacteria bacterium]|nr:ABC transporter permease subunit [Candidatus Latescibacterota bacterium]